jgi:hypothetical protein
MSTIRPGTPTRWRAQEDGGRRSLADGAGPQHTQRGEAQLPDNFTCGEMSRDVVASRSWLTRSALFTGVSWRDPDSNRGHHDFQSCHQVSRTCRFAGGNRWASGYLWPHHSRKIRDCSALLGQQIELLAQTSEMAKRDAADPREPRDICSVCRETGLAIFEVRITTNSTAGTGRRSESSGSLAATHSPLRDARCSKRDRQPAHGAALVPRKPGPTDISDRRDALVTQERVHVPFVP